MFVGGFDSQLKVRVLQGGKVRLPAYLANLTSLSTHPSNELCQSPVFDFSTLG